LYLRIGGESPNFKCLGIILREENDAY
jgi:hypothetical protein